MVSTIAEIGQHHFRYAQNGFISIKCTYINQQFTYKLHFVQHLRDEGIENVFYTSEENKIPVKMMRSRGYYSVGEIASMDCEAIEFPYDVRLYRP